MDIAKGKEWKRQRMNQLGVVASTMQVEERRMDTVPIRAPVQVAQVLDPPIVHTMPQVLPTILVATTSN